MASGLRVIVLLCLTGGLWTAANANDNTTPAPLVPIDDDDCCARCPAGWTQFGDNCYIFFFNHQDWAAAELTCLGLGGNLASVHSKEQLAFIEEIITRSTGSKVQSWVGGYDAVKEGVWLWSDGSKFDFTFWEKGEPNNNGPENCLVLNLNGNANDDKCPDKKSFVCGKSLQ